MTSYRSVYREREDLGLTKDETEKEETQKGDYIEPKMIQEGNGDAQAFELR